ncbi:hypothetical protein RJ639_036173 [Escallonia herrerae]|uniref:Uncharacterized protein n=1 Tax=Escallonia herrerae TaxID=1293975 RepID=A0AA89BHZ2_9ASTE|nr:hypothetical protein RJ639_036173 [Escallonia herrerae]
MGKKVVWSLKKASKEVWPWKKISSGGFKLKRLKVQISVVDDVVFKILYMVEAVDELSSCQQLFHPLILLKVDRISVLELKN